MATAKPTMVMTNGATKTAVRSCSSIFSTPGIHLHVDTESFQLFPFFKAIGTILNKLRHGPQELQLPHKPPRHEKNAGTDPDGEQHREYRTAHLGFLSFTPGSSPFEPTIVCVSTKANLMESRTYPSRKRLGQNVDPAFPRSPRKTAHHPDGERIASADLHTQHRQIRQLE